MGMSDGPGIGHQTMGLLTPTKKEPLRGTQGACLHEFGCMPFRLTNTP